jgi:hypothetical protein
MEEKLDGLMTLLSKQMDTEKQPSTQPLPYPSPAGSGLPAIIEHWDPLGDLDHDISSSHGTDQAFSSFNSYSSLECPKDVISQGIIGFQQAEEYVQIFKSKSSAFPFVVIPSHMSVDRLRREKPFFLLSILTTASDTNEKLQDKLELELRETLGRMIIVNGEISLDLLQGILVYLTWYYHRILSLASCY